MLTSVNWAGYIDTGPTFSSVAGDWVQPTATCPQNQVQQAAFWVGIGGYVQGDPDIEQIGTDSDCLKKKGKKNPGGPNYYAWYQMYPQSLVVLPTSSYPVSHGQTIEASVTVSGANRVHARHHRRRTLDVLDRAIAVVSARGRLGRVDHGGSIELQQRREVQGPASRRLQLDRLFERFRQRRGHLGVGLDRYPGQHDDQEWEDHEGGP